MNRAAVLFAAALDALVAAGAGLAVCFVPALVVWIVHYGMAASPALPWLAGGDVWLLGHGVHLAVAVPAGQMALLGLPAAAGAFPVTVAVTGVGLITALSAARIGYRLQPGEHRPAVVAVVAAVFVGVGLLVALTCRSTAVSAPLWQAAVLPAAVAAAGMASGAAFRAATRRVPRAAAASPARPALARPALARPTARPVRRLLRLDDVRLRLALAAAVRGGVVAALAFAGLAGLVLAGAIFGHYPQIVGLYESVHAGVVGGLVLTFAQILLIPNAVAWSMAWLAGPGFAVGAGTAVTPWSVQIGALPALPVLGAVPRHAAGFGLAAVLLPLAAGTLAGVLAGRRLHRGQTRDEIRAVHPARPAAVAAGIGLVAGLLVAAAVWWSSGAIGPQRLQQFGAAAVAVGAAAAAEIAAGAALALYAGRWRGARWTSGRRLGTRWLGIRRLGIRWRGARPPRIRRLLRHR